MKYILTIIVQCAAIFVFAQNVVVTSSEEYTNQLQQGYWKSVLGQDETGFYVLSEEGPINSTIIVVEKFSHQLKPVFKTQLINASGSFNDSYLHRNAMYGKGNLVQFIEGWNKAKQQNALYVQRFDLEDGSALGEKILLETESAESQLKSSTYNYSFSPDGSKLLVITEKPFVKGGKEGMRLQVFNTSDYSSLWKNDFVLDTPSERYPVQKIAVNNEGIAYVFKDIKGEQKERFFHVFTVNGSQFNKQEIALPSFNRGQFKIQIDHKGNLIAAGTLAPKGRPSSQSNGYFFINVAHSGDIIAKRLQVFEPETLTGLAAPRSIEKGDFVFGDLNLNDVVLKSDGGVLLLGEIQRSSKVQVGQALPPIMEHTLFFGKVLILSLDQNGERMWSTLMEKDQTVKTFEPHKHFGSFAHHMIDDKLMIVWNFTNYQMDPPLNKYRYWTDRTGAKINIDNLFGREAFYPTLLTVVDENGAFENREFTFNSLPLVDIQKPNSFSMAVAPAISIGTPNGLVVLSHMPVQNILRYKYNYIKVK